MKTKTLKYDISGNENGFWTRRLRKLGAKVYTNNRYRKRQGSCEGKRVEKDATRGRGKRVSTN